MKRFLSLLLFLLLFFPTASNAQISKDADSVKKNSFYFYWGYNRSIFSATDLHFNGPLYDFTLYDIRGRDRPTPFSLDYFKPTTLSIPQWNVRAGYFLSNRLAISVGIDHLKYVVDAQQDTRLSGVISAEASTKYEGAYLNQSISLEEDLLRFEHTDGFNLISLDLEYLLPLPIPLNDKFKLYWNFGIGGIWVVTRTNVRVLEVGLDNDFHLSGYTFNGKMGPRIEFLNRFFFLGEVRGGYASLPSVLIRNSEPEIGDHNLSYLEYYFAVGVNFSFYRRKRD